MILAIIVLTILFFISVYFLFKITKERNSLKCKYSFIIDTEEELKKLEEESRNEQNKINTLKAQYKEKYQIYAELQDKITIYNDEINFINYGLYQSKFNFVSSSIYKQKLDINIENQKLMVKQNKAVLCDTNWIVQGSKQNGAKMIEKQKELILRAFNAQCDMQIEKTKWNNVGQIEKRILKSFSDVNKIGEFHNIYISDKYLELKKEQLWLKYEHQQKLYEEKEEQRERREQMREEQKLQEEIRRKLEKIEEEEKLKAELQRLMDEAYNKGKQDEAEKYKEQIQELTQELENNKRSVSNAQTTKHGHIYIISNIGSFGEDVFKIGMTRRDDPTERVYELGNASVPFHFFIHGLIESENAPELEGQLHKLFEEKRVNKINPRKEFFKVSLNEIEEKINKELNKDIILSRQIDTEDYLRTLAIKNKEANMEDKAQENELLPQEI